MDNKKGIQILLSASFLVLVIVLGLSYLDGAKEGAEYFSGLKIEMKDSYTVGYEGDFTILNYSLKYNPTDFRVANLPNKSEIKIKDLGSGEISKIGIFYNGAAGFSSAKDLFENTSIGKSGSDGYDVVNLAIRMFNRNPDASFEGSAGEKVIIFNVDIGFVYVESRNFSKEFLEILDSFSLTSGEKTSVMPTGIEVKTYFFNDSVYKNNDCTETSPITRTVFDTKNLAEASLRLLLEGPTDAEIDNGYTSSIPRGVWLNSVKIEDGVASADFSKELSSTAGSCNVIAITSQIEKTLLQFPTIKKVKISVEGKTEGILEP